MSGKILDFDSEFFGIKVGRHDGPPGVAYEWALSNEIECLYTLLPISMIAQAYEATALGFRLVDVRVEFSARTKEEQRKVRMATRGDDDALALIARSSFKRTRFYNDRKFPPMRVDDLYENWVREHCETGRVLVTTDENDRPVGFATFKDGYVSLIAVSEEHRYLGHGEALMKGALDLGWQDGLQEIRIVTQGGNIGAQRTFQKVGFRSVQTDLWLHWRKP